jgi:hypothetical protein
MRFEEERLAVERATEIHPGSSRFPNTPTMWARRKYCNNMRHSWTARTGETFAYVFRCRYDNFMCSTPMPDTVKTTTCVGTNDLSLFGLSSHADVECSVADTYPEKHKEAFERAGPKWEMGSELHLGMAMETAGITFRQIHTLGRLLRWERLPDRVPGTGVVVTGLRTAFTPC